MDRDWTWNSNSFLSSNPGSAISWLSAPPESHDLCELGFLGCKKQDSSVFLHAVVRRDERMLPRMLVNDVPGRRMVVMTFQGGD